MESRQLKVEEVALSVGVSVATVNMWYRFKKENPHDLYAQLLPDFSQDNPRGVRLWNQNDIWKLIEFKQKIPKGRNGVMGSVTQRYLRKEEKLCENQ